MRVDQPTYPLPEALVSTLVGMRARDVLSHVQVYRERCIEKGKMAEFPFSSGMAVPGSSRTRVRDHVDRASLERVSFDVHDGGIR